MVNDHCLNSKIKDNIYPLFITGYSVGEGSFSIRFRKNYFTQFGFNISIVYCIAAEINPVKKKLLEQIKEYFAGVGSISLYGSMYCYEISSVKSLINLRKHFEKFPLQTTKFVHFKLWCQVLDILERKEHLTKLGFDKVLSIKSVFPKGLLAKVLEVYLKISPKVKPVFETSKMRLDSNWIAGFVQADGTFGLNYTKQKRMTHGYTCQPQFRVTQHERDLIVLCRILESMACKTIVKPSGDRDRYSLSVANISNLVNLVIPFFEKYPIYGAKHLDFLDFCKGVSILKNKGHLTSKGLEELRDLAYGMNTYRKF